MAAQARCQVHVAFTAFMDGRDVDPTSGLGYVDEFCALSWPTSPRTTAAMPASPPFRAAITPWTATSAGSASSSPTTPWPSRSTVQTTTPHAGMRGLLTPPTTSRDEFVKPFACDRTRRISRRRQRRSSSTSVPTVRARSPCALTEPDFDGFQREQVAPSSPMSAMTEYDAHHAQRRWSHPRTDRAQNGSGRVSQQARA